jgi:hypothetical protein
MVKPGFESRNIEMTLPEVAAKKLKIMNHSFEKPPIKIDHEFSRLCADSDNKIMNLMELRELPKIKRKI